MEENTAKRPRFRFSIKVLIGCVTLLAVALGGWIGVLNYRLHRIEDLRDEGVIVVVRNRTPEWLQRLGFERLSPFYDIPTVELYVTPTPDGVLLGDSEELLPRDQAEKRILEQAAYARGYGAEDIGLGTIGNMNDSVKSWMLWAIEHSLTSVGESRQRYLKRLEANRESGANINP